MEFKFILLRMLVALVMGGIIGAEREARKKPAGFITITLVCLGATMIAILQTELTSRGGDITRMSAQVISGVGFIGGGAILHYKGGVQGLTTAAVLWISACLGLVIGYGMIFMAILSFLCILIIVYGMRWIEEKYIYKRRKIKCNIELKDKDKFKILTEQYGNFENPIALSQVKWVDLEKNRLECTFILSEGVLKCHLEDELKNNDHIESIS